MEFVELGFQYWEADGAACMPRHVLKEMFEAVRYKLRDTTTLLRCRQMLATTWGPAVTLPYSLDNISYIRDAVAAFCPLYKGLPLVLDQSTARLVLTTGAGKSLCACNALPSVC